MKSLIAFSFLSLALLFPQMSIGADDITVPLEINGFKLGTSIENYEFLKHRNYLKDVMVDDIGGFRRGMISFGNCERQGEVVRIKLKYKDDTHKFFKQLLARFKEKFGEPKEFTGDAFGIVLAWKWRFKDKDDNSISLTLQHNKKNLEETMGNMVKLSMPDRIEAERKCFLKICETEKMVCPVNMMSDDWENLIPK